MKLAPEDGDVYLNLANTLESMQRIDDAVAQLRMAIRYLAPLTALKLQLVRLLAKAGRGEEAVQALAELDDLSVIEPEQLLATTGALRLYHALGRDDSISVEHGQEIAHQMVALDAEIEAIAVLQRVHAEYPGNQGITQQLTGVLIDLGRFGEARELLDN